ncbi:MAG: prolyl oligopeptidase family serine peptidase [Acidimicrobiales bacterium]
MTDTAFPRQMARTARFTLGVPRAFAVGAAGEHVLLLRSKNGSDRQTCLWLYDVAAAETRLLVDPTALLDAGVAEDLPPEERARRERAREASMGIVRFTVDQAGRLAAFDLNGRLFAVSISSGEVTQLGCLEPAVDPRLDPSGTWVAYVSGGALRLTPAGRPAPGNDRPLAEPESPDVTYGLAEFVAAEEMERQEGFWWAPDGTSVLVERCDNSPVTIRHIADPARPEVPATQLRYPVAGTANADVTLFVVGLDGSRVEVAWDRAAYEYIVTAHWSLHGLLLLVMSRDQRSSQLLEVDPSTGVTTVLCEDSDGAWLDIVPGVPGRLADGTIVRTVEKDGARRLVVGSETVTEPSLQVRGVISVDEDTVAFHASADPTEIEVFTWSREDGVVSLGPGGGVTAGWLRGGTTVLNRGSLEAPGRTVTVLRDGRVVGTIESLAETPVVATAPYLRRYGPDELRTAVIFPRGHVRGSRKLPVLMSPYGGPQAQMVLASTNIYLEKQWFADQGFAVVVADGHGTPGRGPEWDRSIRGDLATVVLQDQVVALHCAAAEWPDLDLSRVGIRGWSFGGYLSAMAVLRRPDVFHAAVAGAPVTDFRLYDTCYTERYLGHPDEEPENYDKCSLLGDAAGLSGQLLLIHGMADDNVTVANTLQLSSALLAAGRPHAVIPLTGVTHMTSQEVVATNRLLLELEFLRSALRIG